MGNLPQSLAVGDFNGDGKPDLAVTNYLDNTVSILLGKADGTFQPHVDYTVGAYPGSIAVGDFNGDGKLDLAITLEQGNIIAILLGNGDGTFGSPTTFAVGGIARGVAAGDFNNDGNLDLAVTVSTGSGFTGAVSILLGNGDGTFQPNSDIAFANTPGMVAAVDLNNDGKLDLVLATGYSDAFTVLLGNGDGTFQSAVNYSVGGYVQQFVIGDFNGDGFLDVVLPNSFTESGGLIFLGKGDGTFQPSAQIATGNLGWSGLVAADFNGDGKLDVAFASSIASTGVIEVVLGKGDGTFQSQPMFAGTGSGELATADFNGDGRLDLAYTGASINGLAQIGILLGNGDATFNLRVDYTTSAAPVGAVIGDFNGDGKQDLALVNITSQYSPGTVSVHIGNGDGTFQPPVDYVVGDNPQSIILGDFNGDGKLDLAVVNGNLSSYGQGSVSILLGNGDGTFQSHVDYPVAVTEGGLAAGDFNGDGRLDLAVASGVYNGTWQFAVAILVGNGDGTFQPATQITIPNSTSTAYSVVAADFNHDGKSDLAVTDTSGHVYVFLANNNGTFGSPTAYSVPGASGIAAADFNGDGSADLAVTSGNGVFILLGKSDGTFQSPVTYSAGGGSIVLADFNGDGKLDIATNGGSILLGNGDGTFDAARTVAFAGLYALGGAAGDFNGDGVSDLVIANGYSNSISIFLSHPVIALSPSKIAFPAAAVGNTTPAQTITVSNPGSAPLAISSMTISGPFPQTTTCGTTLAIGANCTISVAFAPSQTGPATGTITFVDNVLGPSQMIALSGTGFTGPGAVPSPASVSFVDQEVTTAGAPEVITLTNNGSSTLSVTNVAASGDFAQTNNCGAVAPGSDCTISVTFTPTALGKRTGTLTVTDNAWNNPLTVQLTGKGVGPLASVSPSSLTFTGQLVGSTSAAQTVTVNNNGHSPLNITNISTSGNFGQTNSCTSPVAANSSCSVSVTFTPSSRGTITGGLTVTSNASNSPNVATLAGQGISSYILLSTQELYFGDQLVGITSATYPVMVYNYGETPLTFTSISTTGNFSQTNDCAGGVASMAFCTVNVAFVPATAGSASGTLNFVDNAVNPSPVVQLSGTGTTSYAEPYISSISPTETVAGGAGFTLTINGYYFGPSSVVYWNGSPRTTTVVTGGRLTATIPASDIAAVGVPLVTVVSPSPGGTSPATGFDIISGTTPINVARTDIPVGDGPAAIVTADFNGDGIPDFAVTNTADYSVSVFLGNGDGTFRRQPDLGVPSSAVGIVAADFNHDGKLDLAVLNSGCPAAGGVCGTGSVSVLLGNGDGTFQSPLLLTFNYNMIGESIAAGDFNGDGIPDLAVGIGGYPSGAIAIYLGKGDGTFSTGVQYQIGPETVQAPPGIVVADFNSDGKADLAVTTGYGSTAISVLLGKGDGTFQSAVQYATGASPSAILAADINGDGKLDLVVTNQDTATNSLSVLFGNGDGTFQNHVDYPTGVSPVSLAYGDFNGDGIPDLIVADGESNTLSVLFGSGGGTFKPNQDFAAGTAPVAIVAKDFNGDGAPDLAVVNYGSNSVSIFLQQVPVITAGGTSLNFGNQPVGTTSESQPVSLKNTGTAALTILGITFSGTNPADFGQTNTCGSSLAVGASCTINITFTPSVAGPESATMSLSDNASGAPLTVTLSGTGTAAAVNLSNPSLSFSNQPVGAPSTAQVETVTNTGTSNLTISTVTLEGSNPGDFTKGTDTCTAVIVLPNATCTVSVTFTPSAMGTRSASLNFNDNAANSPQSVTLSGTGTAAAISFSSPSLSFGNQLVSTPSSAMTETITNTGNANLLITTVTMVGANNTDFAKSTDTCTGATVAPTNTCTVSVTFTPLYTGSRSASLSFADNAPGTPQPVSLSGNGIAPNVNLSSYNLSFATLPVGTASSAQMVTITNTGTANLTFSAISTSGANAGDFAKSADTCSTASVAPNGTCTVSITFTPSASGYRSASLNLADNASNSPQSISLSGYGGVPNAYVSPGTLDFGSQLLGTTTSPLTATVTNNGGANLHVSKVSSGTGYTQDFAITSDNCTGATVAPNATCTVSFVFTPLNYGTRSCSFYFTDDASNSPQGIVLTGIGIAPALTLSASSLRFANELPGATSPTQVVTAGNTGSANLIFSSVAITGADAGDFIKTADTCTGTAVAPNSTCSVTLAFKPTAAGNRVASLSLADNASPSPQLISLYGAGPLPVPFISQPISPASTAPGGPPFTLTIHGAGFLPGATVNWNGVGLATTYASNVQLTATVPAADIASMGTAFISVNNPGLKVKSNVIPFSVSPPTSAVSFVPSSSSPITTVGTTLAIATGDFNGDGKLDLAVGTENNYLAILLGNGDGSFAAPQTYLNGNMIESIAAGDFNGDGVPDLAVAYGNYVSILLGNGDGTFAVGAQLTLSAGSPCAIAVGDFNGDGNLDLAVSVLITNQVAIFLGNGDGTFTRAPLSPATGTSPIQIGVSDFNGDGKLDLVTANEMSTNMTILLGNGDGTFTPTASPLSIPGLSVVNYLSLAVGDFNQDGIPDLAVTADSEGLIIFAGNGDGTFATPSILNTSGDAPSAVALGDFNASGFLGAAVANTDSSIVAFFLGKGSGNFTNVLPPAPTGLYPDYMAAGDFNGDGRLDVVTTGEPQITVLLQSPPAQQAWVSPTTLAFGNQFAGTSSTPQSVTLNNAGSGTLSLASISLTGDNSGDFGETDNCNHSLAAGGACTMEVTMNPSALGARSATLVITDNSGGVTGTTQTVSLSGTGLAVPTSTGISAPAVPYGSAGVVTASVSSVAGTISGNVSLSVDNGAPLTQVLTSGHADFTLNGLSAGSHSLNATYAAQGYILASSATGTLQVNPAALTITAPSPTVNVGAAIPTLTPAYSGFVNGQNAGALTTQPACTTTATSASAPGTYPVTCAGAVDSNYNISYAGGTLTVSGPAVSFSAAALTFAAQMAGSTSAAQSVTVTNNGNANLTFTSIAAAAPFAMVAAGTTCSTATPVAAAASCTVAVDFAPTAGGAASGSLSFGDNALGSPHHVALSGTGQDFTITPPSGSPTASTVTPGQPATYTLSVGGQGGLTGTVTFTCSGAPSEATCTVSPNPATAGNTPTNVTVSVTTTAASLGAPRPRPLPPAAPPRPGARIILLLVLTLAAAAWAVAHRGELGWRPAKYRLVLLAAGLLLALGLGACGGGGGGGGGGPIQNPGTPAGTYTLTVTGATGSGAAAVSHSVNLTLTVS